MQSVLASAKLFAKTLSTERSTQAQSASPANVKFYSAQTELYSSLFAVVTLGSAPNALQLINVFGKFDNALVGASTNIPAEIVAGAPSNPLLRQFIAYKGDASGAAYFAHTESAPPTCEEFNYSFMIFGDGSDSFGIKSSSWKEGDGNVYSFKISELTPIEVDPAENPAVWCKSVLPPVLAAAPLEKSTASDVAAFIGMGLLLLVIISLIVGALVFAQRNSY